MDIPAINAAVEFDVTEQTISDHYSMLREVCSVIILNDLAREKLGGPGICVEVDEMHLSWSKYGKGRPQARQGLWLVGGIERATRRRFACVVRCRDKRTLHAILLHFLLPGNKIIHISFVLASGYACKSPINCAASILHIILRFITFTAPHSVSKIWQLFLLCK